MSQYVHVGIVLITVPNLIVIGLMLVVFALAVAVSLPQHPRATLRKGHDDGHELDPGAPPAAE
ncbi:MAG TPA: hypothetical protein VGN32_08570 [Ktedonobacterales bacterium]|jgi:hypothetical protein|nr:hypothetical protein [Ktedonobacterales bacterium]